MNIRHPVLATLVAAAVALAFAATADANGPRGNPGAKLVTAAASAPAPRRAAPAQRTRSGAAHHTRPGAAQHTRPGTGPTARPGTPGAANPGQQPEPGMMHVKPGNNPNARVTFNVPATPGQAGAPRTNAGSATGTRPNTAPRTNPGSATTVRPNTAQPGVPAAGTRGAARNTRRDAGTWTPYTTADSATATRPNTAPRTSAVPQPNIQQVKSSRNARGDGRVSTMGQGPRPAPDNARQLADYMMIESTLQQQRAPKTPKD